MTSPTSLSITLKQFNISYSPTQSTPASDPVPAGSGSSGDKIQRRATGASTAGERDCARREGLWPRLRYVECCVAVQRFFAFTRQVSTFFVVLLYYKRVDYEYILFSKNKLTVLKNRLKSFWTTLNMFNFPVSDPQMSNRHRLQRMKVSYPNA